MPRNDDSEDDDRPRRRRPRDDEDDRPARSRRDEDDDRRARSSRRDDDEDRPARSRRRRREFDDDRPSRTKKKSNLGLILGIVLGIVVLVCGAGGFVIYRFVSKVGSEVAARGESADNLREIGLKMHQHHDQFGNLPTSTYHGGTGQPLLSWRVHMLPRFGQHTLYAQFKIDEPWDGPNNRQLLSKMPKFYATSDMRLEDGKTYYRGFSHQGACFERPPQPPYRNPLTFARISDGLANTILVVEAGEPTEWTKPDDLEWLPGRPMPPLGRGPGDRVMALMADGSVRAFKKSMPESTWRALTTYSGNEMVNPE